MDVVLVNIRSDGKQVEAKLSSDHTVIGRRDDCQIRIPVASVSRQHCELVRGADSLTIRDLGSSNGTLVNGEKVEQAELKPGDLITVGEVVLVVRINGEPASIDSDAAHAKAKPSEEPTATPSAIASREDEVFKPLVGDSDDSSVDFDFDFDDDDDEQPPLA